MLFFGLPEEPSASNGGEGMQDGMQLPAEVSKDVIYKFLEAHLQIDRPREKKRISKSTPSWKT